MFQHSYRALYSTLRINEYVQQIIDKYNVYTFK